MHAVPRGTARPDQRPCCRFLGPKLSASSGRVGNMRNARGIFVPPTRHEAVNGRTVIPEGLPRPGADKADPAARGVGLGERRVCFPGELGQVRLLGPAVLDLLDVVPEPLGETRPGDPLSIVPVLSDDKGLSKRRRDRLPAAGLDGPGRCVVGEEDLGMPQIGWLLAAARIEPTGCVLRLRGVTVRRPVDRAGAGPPREGRNSDVGGLHAGLSSLVTCITA